MGLYRKKPVVIEARQFTASNGGEVAYWCRGHYHKNEPFGQFGKQVIEIDTLEGMHKAIVGDWIIRGVKGEFYPCKPDVFEQTYDPAEES